MSIEKIPEGSGASSPDVRAKLNEVIDLLNEMTAGTPISLESDEADALVEDLAALDSPESGTNQVA